MERKTLEITVDRSEETLAAALENARNATEGEDYESLYRLNFESIEGLATVTKVTNLSLLRAIRQHEPESISELAEVVDRDYREVHRNLDELETLGVIEFEKAGRAKKPVVLYDDLEIHVPLRSGDSSGDSESQSERESAMP